MNGRATRRRRLPGDGGFVYAIGAQGDPLVKFGRTADRGGVAGRLQSLRAQSPISLECFAAIACVDKRDLAATEWAMHDLFAAERQHGEWFRRTAAVDRVIEAVVRTFGRAAEPELVPEAIRALRAVEEQRLNAAKHWEEVVGRWKQQHYPGEGLELPPPPERPAGYWDDLGVPFAAGFDFVNGRLRAAAA